MFFSKQNDYQALYMRIYRLKQIGKDTTALELELDAMREAHEDEKARKKEEEAKKKNK